MTAEDRAADELEGRASARQPDGDGVTRPRWRRPTVKRLPFEATLSAVGSGHDGAHITTF